jgi:hypothetical protein
MENWKKKRSAIIKLKKKRSGIIQLRIENNSDGDELDERDKEKYREILELLLVKSAIIHTIEVRKELGERDGVDWEKLLEIKHQDVFKISLNWYNSYPLMLTTHKNYEEELGKIMYEFMYEKLEKKDEKHWFMKLIRG